MSDGPSAGGERQSHSVYDPLEPIGVNPDGKPYTHQPNDSNKPSGIDDPNFEEPEYTRLKAQKDEMEARDIKKQFSELAKNYTDALEYIGRLKEQRDQLERELASRWLPITQAPKDGTVIQGWRKGGWVPEMRYHERSGGWQYKEKATWWTLLDYEQPTHFLPLPPPPQP